MYHKPRMCRTCLQMSRGDFKFVNLDSVDPLWESNSPNLKEQLIYIVPEMKLESTETYICTSCFIALRTAYEFKRMCQVTEQKFQNYNYKYRRPFGVGPGSPQFHVTLNENCNNSSSVPTYRCQNLNYLQTDTSIDITEHHLYDASKVLPRKQLAYLNNVSQKLPEIDVEVIMGQNSSDKSEKSATDDSKESKNEKLPENKIESKSDNKIESKPNTKNEAKVEKKTETKPDKKIETKTEKKIETKPEKKIERKIETKPDKKIEIKSDKKMEIKSQSKNESKLEDKAEIKSEKKIENKLEVRIETKSTTSEEGKRETIHQKEPIAQKDTKSKPIFPNLPGIEIVPKKLDSVELRKKYNIGSQISILKTPKQVSTVDSVLKKACEEIPYLKANNILPESLNCSVRLETLTSQLTTRVTTEKYTAKELDEIAKTYYAGCSDTLLDCKLCNRSFSTEHWLKVHEEEHNKPKRVENLVINEVKKDHVIAQAPTEAPTVASVLKLKNIEECGKASIQPTVKEVTPNTNKITIPLQLQNDQISITPIQKSSALIIPKQNVVKTIEKSIEPKLEAEISLSTIKKSTASTTLPIIKSSEISLIKADNMVSSQSSSKEKENENTISKIEEIPKPELKVEKTNSSLLTVEKPTVTEILEPTALKQEPSPLTVIENPVSTTKSKFKINHFKSLLTKKKNTLELKYYKCFVCFKYYKSKLSLYQHCKFNHIPNVSSSSYWANCISFIKEQKLKEESIVTDDKEYEEEEEEVIDKKGEKVEDKEEEKAVGINGEENAVDIKGEEVEYKEVEEAVDEEVEDAVDEEGIEAEDEEEVEVGDEEDEEVQEETKEIVIPERIAKTKRTDIKQHICNICDKHVKEADHLTLHMYVHTPTFVSMDPDVRSDENGDIFRCYLCEKIFPKERYLKLHNLQVHLTKSVVCKICNREFKSEFWFSRHKCVIPSENPEPEEEAFDEEGKEFSCTLCDRKFARLRFMKSHRKRMHKNILEKPSSDDANNTLQTSVQDHNDSEESEHSGYESNHEYDLPDDDTKEHDRKIREDSFTTQTSENTVNNLNEVVSKRRSLSRGVPKIQCDFCGEYIEETIYDKHIFEHNKLRLNKSLSKRKSLESSVDEASEKKEILLKCHICYKAFKRRHNLIGHMSKHEGVENVDHITADTTGNLSEADETLEDESEVYLSEGEENSINTETIYANVLILNGLETYECCGRSFKFKAHFFRHFKKKHLNCELKLKYEEDSLENSLEPDLAETSHIDTSVEQLSEMKSELDDTGPDKSDVDPLQIEQNVSIISGKDSGVQDSVGIKTETNQTENVRKKRKYTRRIFTFDSDIKKTLALRKLQKHNVSADKDENISHKSKSSSVPLTTNNINKRKLSMDESEGVRKPNKTPKLMKKSDKADTKTEGGEDMAATALHLRQLDLLPVTTKTLGGYECHICDKKFKQKCQLRDHFNVHTGDRPYKCDFCKPVKGFTQTSSLYVHFRRVHAVVTKNCSWEVYSKNGDCLICSDVFFKHSQMFNHMKTYYVENEFECHVCNKTFNMSCHFKTHNIAPEEMQHLFIKDDVSNEDDNETLPENEADDKVQSDTDTAERNSIAEDTSKVTPIRCSKCDKTFVNKQQLRFHKKSLAHFQQTQAKRRKTKTKQEVHVEEEEEEEEDDAKTDATDTIEDIENGVKAIIKKIRKFKKHHCNICGSSFIRRMQLRKHKIIHNFNKSKDNVSVDNLEETTTLELQDASELNQFIHDDNLSDEEEESNEMELDQNSTEEIADSTMNSLENSDVLKIDNQCSSTEDIGGCDLAQIEENSAESTLSTSINETVNSEENFSNDVDLKLPEDTADLSEQELQTNTEVVGSDLSESSSNAEKLCSTNTIELPQDKEDSIKNENETSDHLSLTEKVDVENNQSSPINEMDGVETTDVIELPIVSDDSGQSQASIDQDSLENVQTSANHIIMTNESDSISKESDVQSVSRPNLL